MSNKTSVRLAIGTALLAAGLNLTGCASIVHGGNRTVTLNTQPSGAKAYVRKAGGEVVTVQTTPCTVSLDPKKGYFKGQTYVVKFELEGHQTAELELRPTLSGWYFGNIVFGGLIGMIAVDPVTGSMWNIEPAAIQQTLTESQASLLKNKEGFIVVLASDLTPSEREHMTKLN
ncbi:MAG TPA: hypothetical protein VGD81_17525 [Opitutaceae bacterium]